MKQKTQILRLYIAGNTPKSNKAIANLKRYCSQELRGLYTIEIIDLLEHPQLAEGNQIIAVPTLIKKLPTPLRILVGDLSDKTKVLVSLNISPHIDLKPEKI